MDTKDQIREFITKNFYLTNPGTLSDDLSLLESGLVDSTGVLEILAFVEQQFGISVQDDEIVPDHFDGVARIAAFVESKRAGAAVQG